MYIRRYQTVKSSLSYITIMQEKKLKAKNCFHIDTLQLRNFGERVYLEKHMSNIFSEYGTNSAALSSDKGRKASLFLTVYLDMSDLKPQK